MASSPGYGGTQWGHLEPAKGKFLEPRMARVRQRFELLRAILGKTADGAWGLRILPHFEWLPEAERTDRLHCRLVGDRAAPMTLRLPGLKAGAVVSRRDGGRLVRDQNSFAAGALSFRPEPGRYAIR